MISGTLAIIGIILLYFGGDILIKGAIATARNLKISKILVSSIIVGLGTSMPELILSVEAVIVGSSEIAIANIVGSNIANILFIIGISALISPFIIEDKLIKNDFFFMVFATLILVGIIAIYQVLNLYHGLILITILLGYLYYSYNLNKKVTNHPQYCQEFNYDCNIIQNSSLAKSVFLSVLGIILLASGSAIFLKSVIKIAQNLGISKEIIGLGVVAFGSSIPELSAAIIAAVKKHSNIVVASVLGSNIFNILLTGGIISLIDKIQIPTHILKIDIWFMLILTIIFAFFSLIYKKFNQITGGILLAIYATYFYLLFT